MNGTMTSGKPRITLYIDEPAKSRLEELAKKRRRSVNSLIYLLIEDELQKAEDTGELKND